MQCNPAEPKQWKIMYFIIIIIIMLLNINTS